MPAEKQLITRVDPPLLRRIDALWEQLKIERGDPSLSRASVCRELLKQALDARDARRPKPKPRPKSSPKNLP